MELNQYQDKCLNTWGGDHLLERSIHGLNGEAGEVAEKRKKYLRGDKNKLYSEYKEDIKKELGDVLYYVAVCAHEHNIDLATVAEHNIAKLKSRQERGVINSSGDDR